MNTPTVLVTPLACAQCRVPRRRHDAPDHTYQVPDMNTALDRANALKNARAAA